MAGKETSKNIVSLELSFSDPIGSFRALTTGELAPRSASLGGKSLCSYFTQSLATGYPGGGRGIESS